MHTYFLPNTPEVIESIAKSIARNRMLLSTVSEIESELGISIEINSDIESTFDHTFNEWWTSVDEESLIQKMRYNNDAEAAIRSINLLSLTHTT